MTQIKPDTADMPLPPSPDRTQVHTRRIACEAFERADGLWDIDAHLVDTRAYDTATRKAGQPLHNIWLRLTIDTDLVIRETTAVFDNHPMENCPLAVHPMKSLVGLKIGQGWQKEVNKLIGGALGCTHLRELLAPVATTAKQALWPILSMRGLGEPPPGKGSCFAKSDDEDRQRYRDALGAR